MIRWEDAKEECQYQGGWREGGNLASINSLEEQNCLLELAHRDNITRGRKYEGYYWHDGKQ